MSAGPCRTGRGVDAAAPAFRGVASCQARGHVPGGRGGSGLDQCDLVAHGDLAAARHSGEHAAPALKLGAQALAQLVHPVARVADTRDLELRLARADALTDRPLLDVVAFDGDVLADRAGLDVDGVEVFLRDE